MSVIFLCMSDKFIKSSRSNRVSLRKRVAALSLPVLLSALLQRLVAIVDIFLVGGVGASAIAATGLGQLLVFAVMTVFWGLATGTSVVIAHLDGAGRRNDKRLTATSVIVVSLCAAVIFSFFGSSFGLHIATYLGASDDVLFHARGYIRLVFQWFFFTAGINTLSAIHHGSADTKTPMKAIILVNILHVIIAYPLIYGKLGFQPMGVIGAAYSINISEAVGFFYLFFHSIKFRHLSPKIYFSYFKRVWQVGYPAALERIAQQSGQLIYSKFIISFGTTAYAAHQVGLSIESLSFMPGAGMGIAAATLMGQSLGSKKYMRAKLGHNEAMRLALLVMGFMALVFLFFPAPLLKLFTDNIEVIRHGSVFLRLVALAQIPLALSFVYAGSLRGTGDTHYVFIVTLATMWGVRVLLAWLVAEVFSMSLYAVWGVFVIDWYVRAFLFARRYHKRDLHQILIS